MLAEEILQAREQRYMKRCELCHQYSSPVISITLNIPGLNKINEIYKKVSEYMYLYILSKFQQRGIPLLKLEEEVTSDGYCAYIVADCNGIDLKKMTVSVEEDHKIGRFFDIDVMDEHRHILSRSELGLEERQCYLCENKARICIIKKNHTKTELISFIDTALKGFLEGEGL